MQRKAIQLQTERKGASDRMTLLYRNLLVRQLTDNKQYELAIKEAHEIVQLSQQNFGKSHPQNLKHLVNLVEAYASSNQLSNSGLSSNAKCLALERKRWATRIHALSNRELGLRCFWIVHNSTTRQRLSIDKFISRALTLFPAMMRIYSFEVVNLAIFLDEQGRSQESVQLLRDLLPKSNRDMVLMILKP